MGIIYKTITAIQSLPTKIKCDRCGTIVPFEKGNYALFLFDNGMYKEESYICLDCFNYIRNISKD